MRKSPFFWLFLAGICGGVLFDTSQKVTDGRARLAELHKSIRSEEESIRVLQAEWSYLNQPERLEKLATQYLDLVPMTGAQFAKLGDIAKAPENPPEKSPPDNPAGTLPAQGAATADAAGKPTAPITTSAKIARKPKAAPKTARPAAPSPRLAKKPAPATPKPAARTAAAAPEKRDFGDLMKSLGVQ